MDFPGGLVEENETNQQALIREVFEETKLEVAVGKLIGEWAFLRSKDNQVVTVQNYLTTISSVSEIQLSNEHLEYKWVKLADLKNYKFKDESVFQALPS